MVISSRIGRATADGRSGFSFDRVMSHAHAGVVHGVMQRWKASTVKGALAFGSGLFLTTHFLFQAVWGIALVLGLVFGLGYGFMVNYLHSGDD
jgi:hypothetical protein